MTPRTPQARSTRTIAPGSPPATPAQRTEAQWGLAIGVVASLVIASSGAAWTLSPFILASAQQAQPETPPSTPPEIPPATPPSTPPAVNPQPDPQPPAPAPPTPNPQGTGEPGDLERRAAEEVKARMEAQAREQAARAALQPGIREAVPVPDPRAAELGNDVIPIANPPGPVQPADTGAPDPARGVLVGKDDPISMNFTDSVDLMAFVDWVSKTLNINIITDESLSGRRVVFRAPVKVKANELLQLLSRLIEDQDFIFSRDPLGFYTIKPSTKVPIVMAGAGVDLPTTRVISTPMVRPSIMQQAVQSAMGSAGGAVASGGVRITAVDDIGIMIVTGSGGGLSTVESLVNTIQAELANQKLHRFALEHVAADFALNRILVLNGKVAQQFGGGQQIQQVPATGAGGVSGPLTHLDSRLFIDPGNAIIFRGTDAEASQVKAIISVIDVVNTLIARRYATGSVTSDVASAGERIGLGPATQTGSSTNNSFSGVSPAFRNQGGFQGQQGSGSDLPGSGFAVDIEKGSIIYYGTEAQHALVAQLVKTFTEQALSEDTEIRAYKLLYAKAETVSEVLNNLLESPADRTANSSFLPRSTASRGTSSPLVTPPEPTQPTAGARPGGEESATLTATRQDTVVVADRDRNQILVKASGRQQREFARIIRKLDERQPQVYIEAQIVAVRLDNTFTFSSDLRIDANAFQFLSSFGLTAPAAAAATPLNTFPRIFPNPGQGVTGATAALINQDHVTGIIRALQVVGDARIVSTPRILVNDNETANQASEREEPFAATSQTAGNPQITSQGGTARAGTSLEVTPTISQNGDIVLEYAIELSNFDRSATSNPNLQPPKQTENYNSKVTVPSDSTIVVGGFTFESRQKTESKVPFFGDIPVVGMLFKSIGEVTNRTTIFVFITPRVLTDPTGADLRILSEGPAREMDADMITPDLKPEAIAISPRSMSLPALDQSRSLPGTIDPLHAPRRTPARPEPMDPPATEPLPGPVTQANPAAPAIQ